MLTPGMTGSKSPAAKTLSTITLTGWSSGDETTYGAYFTGEKKIVFSTPGQSPMVEAARKTPGYSG